MGGNDNIAVEEDEGDKDDEEDREQEPEEDDEEDEEEEPKEDDEEDEEEVNNEVQEQEESAEEDEEDEGDKEENNEKNKSNDFLSQTLSQVSIESEYAVRSRPSTPDKLYSLHSSDGNFSPSTSPHLPLTLISGNPISCRKRRRVPKLQHQRSSDSDGEEFHPRLPQNLPSLRRKSERAAKKFKITLQEIQPLPAAQKISTRRGRTPGKATILTDSSFRNQLIENLKKREKSKPSTSRSKAHSSSMKTPSESEDTDEGEKNEYQSVSQSNKTDNDDDAACLYCSELYSVSTGSWIQCDGCGKWAHEACAGTSGRKCLRSYKCSDCRC